MISKRKKFVFILTFFALMFILSGCACKHENIEVRNAVEPDCENKGYTGDTICVKCNKVLAAGESIAATGHTAGEPRGTLAATCTKEGYTGDILCTVCQSILESGKEIAALGHTEGQRVNAIAESCSQEGYTGDVYCTVCNEQLASGKVIPTLAHTPSEERVDVLEPDCENDGHTGRVICTVCGAIIDVGESIPALGHVWGEVENRYEADCLTVGYTGDRVCSVCGDFEFGEVIPIPDEHQYEEGVCTLCGWLLPGLYVDDVLIMSWDDLTANGYVVVENGMLISIEGNMQMGRLVIGEDVTCIDGNYKKGFDSDTLAEVWVPRSVTELGKYLIRGNRSIKEVRLFCQVYSLDKGAFCDSVLEKIVLPKSVCEIGEGAFSGTNLKEIDLPQGLEYIHREAFYSTDLEEIVLPEGLEYIGKAAFGNSKLKSITLPSTITEIKSNAFIRNEELVTADFSACVNIDYLGGGQTQDCPKLENLILPSALEGLKANMLEGCTNLKHISFPDGFKEVGKSSRTDIALESVVWPVSLIDAGALAYLDLKHIYYRGTEAQWKMTTAASMFPNATIEFDYGGE